MNIFCQQLKPNLIIYLRHLKNINLYNQKANKLHISKLNQTSKSESVKIRK